MPFARALRQLWRHRWFRRLLAVRVATQSSDGVLQTALAAYVLFSPERQPDAASIAAVLAITLLPFSVLGPFVGVVLDRFSRRQVLVVIDLARAALALGLAAVVATGARTGGAEAVFYGGVLLAMSLNRFLLAALSASLPHTIDPEEYLVANAVVPTVGPAGALLGVGVATGLRLGLGQVLADHTANAVLFAVAAAGFGLSTVLALRIPRHQLGPDDVERSEQAVRGVPGRASDVVAGLVDALAHLRERRPAALGLLTIFAHRVVYGIVTVAMILVYRNHFHPPEAVEAAIADLGLLVVCSGAGFVAAGALAPPLSGRYGLRAVLVGSLAASAAFQVLPGSVYARPALLVAGFLLGLTAQVLKIGVDTLVQAHVADDYKGRVFVLYDMVFNVALVLAAVVAAAILPTDGRSVPILVTLAGIYAAVGIAVALATRRLPMDAGTESMHADPSSGNRPRTARSAAQDGRSEDGLRRD